MIRVVSAAVVLVDVAMHGWTLVSQVSPASVVFATAAMTLGACPLVRRWSDAIFCEGEEATSLPLS